MTGYLIFDIETVVDNDFFESVASNKQKEKMKNETDFFHPAIYHIPIAISCLYTNNDNIIVENDKNFKFISFISKNGKEDEVKVINKFFEVLNGIITFSSKKDIGIFSKNDRKINYPVLVTHNGTNFDLPVITLKALKYYDSLSDTSKNALSEYLNDKDKWEDSRPNYTNKNSKFNLDTNNIWNFTLKSICTLFEIEVKNTMDGSKVEEYYNQGKYDKVAKYCAEDVFALSKVLNKLLIAKGDKPIPLPETLDECIIINL
jgi:hypothetical protein